ncbi:hypothetical protein KFK09_008584 [Dendrobium nobile]|uniref:Uncharacterized protein n=1 Tax=Dendrobium nobile TaxID=94219 RepID=A0A8T3BKG8_DENNO|nr:hypothetical protein KFK09_008584 [Dendrobium nobile]
MPMPMANASISILNGFSKFLRANIRAMVLTSFLYEVIGTHSDLYLIDLIVDISLGVNHLDFNLGFNLIQIKPRLQTYSCFKSIHISNQSKLQINSNFKSI